MCIKITCPDPFLRLMKDDQTEEHDVLKETTWWTDDDFYDKIKEHMHLLEKSQADVKLIMIESLSRGATNKNVKIISENVEDRTATDLLSGIYPTTVSILVPCGVYLILRLSNHKGIVTPNYNPEVKSSINQLYCFLSHCAPSFWYSLPINIRSSDSLSSFWNRLKSYLFHQAFPSPSDCT